VKIVLKNGREKSIFRRHPWVFSGAIQYEDSNINKGDLVDVFSSKNQFLAKGLYQGGSIALKILSFKNEEIDQTFFDRIITESYSFRQNALLDKSKTNAFRLLHGESDGLSGIIIDLYNGTAVIQAHAAGYKPYINLIASALVRLDSVDFVYSKAHKPEDTSAFIGNSGETRIQITENGHQFWVDLEKGQKTGFFLDQRENRKLIGALAHNKVILNACAYTGGFSIYALNEGAKRVDSVDLSENALNLLEENIKINSFIGEHNSICSDVFKYLDKTDLSIYDVVVLDPPAFAKRRSAKHQAIKGYTRLNEAAMRKMKKNSILITFSCSQVIDKDTFRGAITAASFQANRNVKVIHQLNQPIDHPIALNYPESEYLKGLVLQIE
jgi:23S rRNA (cytosine1962-C5)-methyltransferase